MNLRPLLLALACVTISVQLLAGVRTKDWEEVDSLLKAKRPASAVEKLDAIAAAARADGADAEAMRAVVRRITIDPAIGGIEARIVRLQAEAKRAAPRLQPVLEPILADWYWGYYRQNRWQIEQRTAVAGDGGPDLRTWDRARLLAEVERHFGAALAAEAQLKSWPVTGADDFFAPGTAPDDYRPTLYDLLAHDALAYYKNDETGPVAGETEFEIADEDPIFAPAVEFLKWTPAATDPASPKYKAVRLYQALMRFHAGDAKPLARLDLDLARIEYGRNVAVGDHTEERYRAALERFIAQAGRQEPAVRALAKLAGACLQKKEYAQARALALKGSKLRPDSAGARECQDLIAEIEAPAAELSCDRVWDGADATIAITYRNVRKLHFRAVKLDFLTVVADRSELNPKKLLVRKAALQWSENLPATPDYQMRTEQRTPPAALAPGFYAIVASGNAGFSLQNNLISVARVWVSQLALVQRQRGANGDVAGLVLDAHSGEPVAGARVRAYDDHERVQAKTTTDAAGRFSLKLSGRNHVLVADYRGQTVAGEGFWTGSDEEEKPNRLRGRLLVDRGIYRPGQIVEYKGIVAEIDPKAGTYAVAPNREVTVVFQDANGKEIQGVKQRTNDYGSFSGSVVVPRNRLPGEMRLQIAEAAEGWVTFSVEEYKRPKFEVKLAAPVEPARLGGRVTMTGKATAYTGAPIGGAKVKWRVERHAAVPAWCWWAFDLPTKAVAHGTAVTENDGTFAVTFEAAPDPAVERQNEPVFLFNVHADVTDGTGETRTDDAKVRVAYTALQAAVTVSAWPTPDRPVTWAVTTASIDGQPLPAKGTVTIFALREPKRIVRSTPGEPERWFAGLRLNRRAVDPAQPETWETAEARATLAFSTDAKGQTTVESRLPAGIYRAVLETTDAAGQKVSAYSTFEVWDPAATRYAPKLANRFAVQKTSLEPGEELLAWWGTGYERGRGLVEVWCDGQPLQAYWTDAARTQHAIRQTVTEAMRGGFTVRVTYVRENRLYENEQRIEVPWTNKELSLRWEQFRSKLVPGTKEQWSIRIADAKGNAAGAELAGAMYDASLDAFRGVDWPTEVGGFRTESDFQRQSFAGSPERYSRWGGWNIARAAGKPWSYRTWRRDLVVDPAGGFYFYGGEDDEATIVLSPFQLSSAGNEGYRVKELIVGSRVRTDLRDRPASAGLLSSTSNSEVADQLSPSDIGAEALGQNRSSDAKRLEAVVARRALQETAFFLPQLRTDKDGVVKLAFTVPEALTTWKFLAFAHDKMLRAGLLTDRAVTAKDLMVEPNPPRFVREGDAIEFTVKVTNLTDQPQSGTVRLMLADAETALAQDAELGNTAPEQAFTVAAHSAHTYAWRLTVPDGTGFLTYKAVAASERCSDGEEGWLPVLSRRILVTESLPLPMRGPGTREFDLAKLSASGGSDTLRSQSLTVQMVSQPAWYAVMALPYLMEFPYECSEQVFGRYYANAVAGHLVASEPRIRQVLEQWKNTPALESPLAKNEELKALAVEETPWLAKANRETEARRRLAVLCDRDRVETEQKQALEKLKARQQADGFWPWFEGGPQSEYITLEVVAGFGRLRQMGVAAELETPLKAIAGLDEWVERRHRERKTAAVKDDAVEPIEAFYLYARSFYLKDRPIDAQRRSAVGDLLNRAKATWTKLNGRQSEAHLALALQRFGDEATARAIVKSLKERSTTEAELGRYWREEGAGWWWWEAPIETQAAMIEALDEVAHDPVAVEECKVWLLKQKQTQAWPTTKATAEAVYALLRHGANLLASEAVVAVSLGGKPIVPEKVEAGTGFYEEKIAGPAVRPEMGHIAVTKTDDGVSWGAVHWQYLEAMEKVTPHTGTPLKVTKTLWIKETTARGPVLKPVTGPVAVGDELVVRIELRTDRAMEFVHLKDQRGSGTEPVDTISRYRWQDGLGYYQTTRDTATHFFIDYLPSGTYVLEYSVRVQLRGRYQTGWAELQCMYAPEFNSHSESLPLEVK